MLHKQSCGNERRPEMLPLLDGIATVLLADTSPIISLGLPPTSTVTDFDDPHGFVYNNVYGTVLIN